MLDTRTLMSQTKYYESYARYIPNLNRYETWDEAIDRVIEMHADYYEDKWNPELQSLLDEVSVAYKEKLFLGSQRALQFGGEQLIRHQMRLYNCSASYCDREAFFGEIFYILLCGAGAGFSVQKKHIAKLPKIQKRTKQAKTHVIEDSIEGWATSVDVLLSSFFSTGGKYPEFRGRKIYFDTTNIRDKGQPISGGFKAPGPEPLRKALDKIEKILSKIADEERKLKPIEAYDIVMHISDAVLAGGVRRSATLCLFSFDDEEMLNAKTGNWFEENPQRARSNNSALILRNKVTFEQFNFIMTKVKEFGEPGFIFADSEDHIFNPCVEIGLYPQYNGISGWEVCNLTEINGAQCTSKEAFFRACRVASIMGTFQAGYTNFKFLGDITQKIVEREALLGVSITGWMNNPNVLLDAETLKEGARIVKEVNEHVAKLLNINPAARTTCVKPSGNASVLLECVSSVSGEHAPRYLRNVQMNKDTDIAKIMKEENPYMIEESVWSASKSDYVIAFPIVPKEGSIYKKDLLGVKLLENVKLIQENWVNEGTNIEYCVDKTLRHNVSNTIVVDDWDDVTKYIYDNRAYFAGISLMSDRGDKAFNQAPFTEVKTADQILSEYGESALFASGLVVDALSTFDNLWNAISTAIFAGQVADSDDKSVLKNDWIRRFKKFSEVYQNNNYEKTDNLLKDVYLLHKWNKIKNNFKDIDWKNKLTTFTATDIDTMGAAACASGQCEI